MVTIVDYGMGNLGSIKNMLRKIGCNSIVTNNPKDLISAQKIILPGVGSFDKAMSNLELLGLKSVLKECAINEIPILGICLGMQLLSTSSEEGSLEGLCLIPGSVLRFKKDSGLKIPHMGWNRIECSHYSKLFAGFEFFEETRFYFVHSYYFRSANNNYVTSTAKYGIEFASSIQNNNIFGVQFHPEKSHKYGFALLKNFVEKC
jgi:glutamine amidotransferase